MHMSLSWMLCSNQDYLIIESIYNYCSGAYFRAPRLGKQTSTEWFSQHIRSTGLQKVVNLKVWTVRSFWEVQKLPMMK